MAHIWRAVAPEPRAALDTHFDAVVCALLVDMGGRLWRAREAAVTALADLIQVRNMHSMCVTFLC